MFHVLEKRIAGAIASRIRVLYGIETPVQTEQPKLSSFGEIALPAAFQLARELKKAPRAIAQELLAGVGTIEGVAAIEIAGNGYLNIRLDRGYYGAGLLAAGAEDEPVEAAKIAGKIIVEHTNINPNKAAHIGHLRNAILGDTFVRMLRSTGRTVEVQNYIDNTGVQVADVVVGFLHPEIFPQATAPKNKGKDGTVRLPLLGSLRGRLGVLRRAQRGAGVAQEHSARDRIRPRPGSGESARGVGPDRARASGHHVAVECHL